VEEWDEKSIKAHPTHGHSFSFGREGNLMGEIIESDPERVGVIGMHVTGTNQP
jgi:hypothetical protein